MTSACRLASVATSVGLALLSFGCGDRTPVSPVDAATGLDARRASTGGAQRAGGHIILLKEGVTADLTAAVVGAGGKVTHSYREIGVLSATGLSAAAVARLAARPEVQGVSPNLRVQVVPPSIKPRLFRKFTGQRRVRPATDQSGAFFFDQFQWNLRVTQANDAWLTTNQGAGALVCVLDSGIDPNHIDLMGRVDASRSASFVAGETALTDFFFHGTFVAGIITTNGIGVGSVAPDATLCSAKVLDRTGSGTIDAAIAALIYVGTIGADVANMSFGAHVDKNDPGVAAAITATQRALNFASQHGVLLVAAAGNDAVNTNTDPKNLIFIPAELKHVISVGATGPVGQQDFDRIASYSNLGRSGVDIFAPGGDFVEGSVVEDLIISPCSPTTELFACSDGISYLIGDGTSFAAPHVSGEGAVIEAQFPGNQKDEFLTNCILKSADAVTGRKIDPLYDRGRINVLHGAACAPGKKQGGAALVAGSLR